jgi:hypothetical protein
MAIDEGVLSRFCHNIFKQMVFRITFFYILNYLKYTFQFSSLTWIPKVDSDRRGSREASSQP